MVWFGLVWFGGDVPAMNEALSLISKTDVLVIVGKSLNVYPTAVLAFKASSNCPICVIDPKPLENAPGCAIRLRGETISDLKKLSPKILHTT